MSIDANETPNSQTEELEGTVNRDLSKCVMIDLITPQDILNDLEAGRDREAIRKRYAYTDDQGNVCELEKWMVDDMFKDPLLKGKKPSKKRRLPFSFAATKVTNVVTDEVPTNTVIEEPEVEEPEFDEPAIDLG